MAGERVNGGDEFAVGIGLEQIAACACLDDFAHQMIGFVNRKNEHFTARRGLANLTRGLNAVQLRHADVENDNVRPQLAGLGNRFASSVSFGTDLPAGLRFENGSQPAAQQRVVVGQKYPEAFHSSSPNSNLKTG